MKLLYEKLLTNKIQQEVSKFYEEHHKQPNVIELTKEEYQMLIQELKDWMDYNNLKNLDSYMNMQIRIID